jgi:hypothetical protein
VLTCTKVEVVGEDGKTGANQERDRTWVSHLTASSFIEISDYERDIGILE